MSACAKLFPGIHPYRDVGFGVDTPGRRRLHLKDWRELVPLGEGLKGDSFMLAAHRGRMTAITIVVCATCALKASAEIEPVPQNGGSASALGENLLRNSENSTSVDTDWVLRSEQRSLPTTICPADHVPLTAEPFARPALRPARAPALPHVDTPAAPDEPADVNDRLVPVPVVHVGWALVLCVFMFNLGAKVLRIRRPASN